MNHCSMIAKRKFRTKQARKRERVRVALKSVTVLIGTSLFCALLVYATHLDFLRLEQVTVDTDGIIEKSTLTAALGTNIDGTFLGVLPKDTVFRVSHNGIKDALLDEFPRIETIEFARTGFYDLHATVLERTPSALWCGDVVPPIAYVKLSDLEGTSDNLWGSCYLIDKSGYIYARAPLYSGNMMPRYYGSLEHAEPIAQQYIDTENFERWQKFNAILAENNLSSHAMLFVDERDVEVYLTNGLKVLMPRQEDVEVTARRLFALLDSGSIDVDKEVEYVDLRFGNKAFVKYFGDNVEE